VLLYVENEFGCNDELIHEVVVVEEFSVFVATHLFQIMTV